MAQVRSGADYLNKDLRCQLVENAWILLPLLFILILITYFLFPLMDGIVLGVVLAYVARPIRDKFGRRRRLGSIVATIAIILPIVLILGLGGVEVVSQLNWVVENQGEIIRRVGIFLRNIEIPHENYDILSAIYDIPPAIYEDLTGSLKTMIEILARILSSLPVFSYGMSLVLTALNLVASIYVCYFLLMDGGRLARGVMTILPSEDISIYKKYSARIDSILSGIFIGAIYTAIVSGLISAIVFYAFGIPRPFALASIVFISGMIPVLSSWLVIVPITLYRYFEMGLFDALLFFAVSTALIYLPSDLVIRPYIVSTKSTIHPLLVILSFVGGVLVAGIGGFFLAPALMGIVVGVYQVQKEETESSSSFGQVAMAEEAVDWSGDEEAPNEKEPLREGTETE
ncbi:MAG TPA: AI-2E family transporter [Methanothrix sp.]|nr:AI-2E family transporter [Methanothrix sp.]HPJ84501.1 AI-2E family transporter [Methanothrix sp.]HPR66200.1 AI-2E family transporter [Methanothrix sp.]